MEVKGYEKYRVYSCGTVVGAYGGILELDFNSTGYARVTLCKDGITKRVFVHRLVAEHFCEKYPDSECVNHIDGDITNNYASNLEWTTNSYNVKDGFNRGRVANGKYSDYKIQQIILMYMNGYSIKEIQHRWGGDRGTISKYAKGG